jgi:hypothetical protein
MVHTSDQFRRHPMNDGNIGDFIRARLEEAKGKGIQTPVILVLSERSDHGRVIYAALHRHPMAPPILG